MMPPISPMSESEQRIVKLQAVERWTLGLGAVFALASFAFGRQTGLSVSIGAALMMLNAIAIRRVGERLFRAVTTQERVSPARAVLLFNGKVIGLVAAIWLVVTYLHVSPLPFLVGLTVYPLAIVAFAITHVPPTESADPHPDPLEDPNG